MPYATICPNCSYRWILNEASPRSWSCPECHTLMTGEAQQTTCACEHLYKDHETRREVKNSLSAMTLRGDLAIANAIKIMSIFPALPDPAIGRRSQCACAAFRCSNPSLEAFLNHDSIRCVPVWRAGLANVATDSRGAGGVVSPNGAPPSKGIFFVRLL